jgi:hypothetical protein
MGVILVLTHAVIYNSPVPEGNGQRMSERERKRERERGEERERGGGGGGKGRDLVGGLSFPKVNLQVGHFNLNK